jgi:cyclase
MPVAYGGGLRTIQDIREVYRLGIEKVALNSYAVEKPGFIQEAAAEFGSQSIIVSIDARKMTTGQYEVWIRGGTKATGIGPAEFAQQMEKSGAGEILLTSIDRDGTYQGYDLDLIHSVTTKVSIPVIACGGARSLADFSEAVKIGGASACAAGSMFVYFGRNRAVLVNFPARADIESALKGDRG